MAKKRSSNKGWIIGGIAIAIAVVLLLWVGGTYNSLVTLDESVNNAWGNVQTAYQRRADLIPQLVATVKQYTDYEGNILTEVTEARASIGRAQTPAELGAAGAEMNSALSRLLVVMENYPDLKANQNYLSLQDQLEGTENRIKRERDLFNAAVKSYNVKVRRVPSNMIAGMFGFDQKEFFESDEGAETAPDVGELFGE